MLLDSFFRYNEGAMGQDKAINACQFSSREVSAVNVKVNLTTADATRRYRKLSAGLGKLHRIGSNTMKSYETARKHVIPITFPQAD